MSMNDPSHIEGYTVGGGETSTRNAYQWDLSAIVPPNTPENDPLIKTIEFPMDGWLTELAVGWPNYTQQAAGVQLRRATDELLFPRNDTAEYIAMENFSHAYPIKAEITEGDQIQARFANNDWEYDHMINVVATVEEI